MQRKKYVRMILRVNPFKHYSPAYSREEFEKIADTLSDLSAQDLQKLAERLLTNLQIKMNITAVGNIAYISIHAHDPEICKWTAKILAEIQEYQEQMSKTA